MLLGQVSSVLRLFMYKKSVRALTPVTALLLPTVNRVKHRVKMFMFYLCIVIAHHIIDISM